MTGHQLGPMLMEKQSSSLEEQDKNQLITSTEWEPVEKGYKSTEAWLRKRSSNITDVSINTVIVYKIRDSLKVVRAEILCIVTNPTNPPLSWKHKCKRSTAEIYFMECYIPHITDFCDGYMVRFSWGVFTSCSSSFISALASGRSPGFSLNINRISFFWGEKKITFMHNCRNYLLLWSKFRTYRRQ